jgi:BirA family biotin operon repressor/biotin-[acetyl-CoA-carboxylase] ligase
VGGILVERRSSSAVIVGIGINVNQSASELPGPQAQSLRTLGAGSVNRERLIAAVVAHLLGELSRWNSQDGDAQAGLAADYTALCLTVGQRVQAILPSAEPLEGIAVGVAESGALLISTDTQIHEVSAGDIVHLRPNIVGG